MDIEIVAVGKLRPYYRHAADDDIRRLRRYTHVREQEVREASRAPNTSVQQRRRAARLEVKIPIAPRLLSLAREGVAMVQPEVAPISSRLAAAGPAARLSPSEAPPGLNSSVFARASARWSLGPFTFPQWRPGDSVPSSCTGPIRFLAESRTIREVERLPLTLGLAAPTR